MALAELPPLTKIEARGPWGTVESFITSNNKCPAGDFLDHLKTISAKKKDNVKATAYFKFIVLFDQMAKTGQVQRKRFRSEMQGFYAFAHEHRNVQYRFPCFSDGRRWILTHGFAKPGAQEGLGEWPQREIDRAVELRKEYFLRKKLTTKGNP
ncbi:MAG: type II toxin-antitoxin system RelE/ParE family toxin [Planctomycetia bacterium]|nr:type II toxin-antitoxin system RelE/ParE family toxin [Planctomycetia bacterium]